MFLRRMCLILRSKILKIITSLATDTTLDAKINEVKRKIPSTVNLATTTALTTVENKILNLVPKVTIVNKN